MPSREENSFYWNSRASFDCLLFQKLSRHFYRLLVRNFLKWSFVSCLIVVVVVLGWQVNHNFITVNNARTDNPSSCSPIALHFSHTACQLLHQVFANVFIRSSPTDTQQIHQNSKTAGPMNTTFKSGCGEHITDPDWFIDAITTLVIYLCRACQNLSVSRFAPLGPVTGWVQCVKVG